MVKEMLDYRWSSYNGYLDDEDPSTKVTDTETLLGIFSADKQKTRSMYAEYMAVQNEDIYMDIGKNTETMNDEESLKLYKEMLRVKGLKSIEAAKEHDLYDFLSGFKETTNLSIRKIAAITGINKDRLSKIFREIQ